MTEVYVLSNQAGAFWGKGKEWVDGADARRVARFPHRDEAVNTLVELSSRDVDLRGRVLAAPLGKSGEPDLEGATASAA